MSINELVYKEVQTYDLMDCQLARDREQHLACKLFRYREDKNEVAFAVSAIDKIYAHESLTFNDTVACEVISKWKTGLKEDMGVRSDVYVLSNGCRKSSDDTHDYYREYAPGYVESLKANVQHMKALPTTKVGYMTFIKAWKKKIWLKGLLTESGYKLRLVAGIATSALVNGGSQSEVPAPGAQRDHEAEVFQVSNDDTGVAQRRLEDKQPEEKTNTDCLRSTQQCMKSGVAKHFGVAGIELQNGLVDETNITLFAKVRLRMVLVSRTI
nr:zinc finger, CCHC-type [Tanacetum cinerariifolium]